MILNDQLKTQIKDYCQSKPTEECCGLIVENQGLQLIKCKNISDTPEVHFAISLADIEKARVQGTIVAFFHSHPDASDFSEVDRYTSERYKLHSILYCVESDSFNEYAPQGYEIPYINRPFLLGVLDCLQLIRDYYQREFNIPIPDLEHFLRYSMDDWVKSELNTPKSLFYKNHLLQNQFVEVTDLKKHDVILTKLPKILAPVHGMVYQGENLVLHHLPGRESCIEPYPRYLKQLQVCVLRHSLL